VAAVVAVGACTSSVHHHHQQQQQQLLLLLLLLLLPGEAIRTYSGHHKAIVCCALNDSAIDGRDPDA
jgi:hypothetical protein